MSLFGKKRTDGRGPNTKSKAAAVVLSALMLWQSFGSYTPAYGITTEGTSEAQSEVTVDSQNESSALEATDLDSSPLLRVSPGFNKFTITPTIEHADVAYFAYHSAQETQGVTSENFERAQSGVAITIDRFNYKDTTAFTTDWGDGYVLFFIKPEDGYLLTDIGASGNGDFYSLQDDNETFGNIKDYPGLSNVVTAAKDAGYIGVFGWSRKAGSTQEYEVSTAIKGQSPDLVVSAKSDKETVKTGDTLTFTVTLTPQKPDTKKDVTISDVKVNSATINGKDVEIDNLERTDDGTYEGTVSYTVDEENYAQDEVTLNVNASTTYSVKTSMLAGSSVTTCATITKDASCTCKVVNKSLVAVKTVTSKPADGKAYKVGETVNFEVKVTNNGNQTLADIKVNDQLAGAKLAAGESATIEKLAPGETATLHYSYTIQQSDLGHSFKNVVTAKASDGTATTTESETVPVADAEKKSETKKSSDKKSTDKKTGTPKTGDVLLGGGAIAAIAGTGVFGVVASRIRRKK